MRRASGGGPRTRPGREKHRSTVVEAVRKTLTKVTNRVLRKHTKVNPTLSLSVPPPSSLHSPFPRRFVISRVLYGSVKITSYDRHQGEPGNSSRVRGSSQPQGRGGAAAGAAAAGRGGGGGGGGHPPLLATLRSSSWYCAPHTSALSPTVANFHEIEAGEDGERSLSPDGVFWPSCLLFKIYLKIRVY